MKKCLESTFGDLLTSSDVDGEGNIKEIILKYTNNQS